MTRCRCHPANSCGRCVLAADERIDIARRLAEANNECGFIKDDLICTRAKGHDGQHKGQPIAKYVPFE